MKILSWNVRGLGKLRAVRRLRNKLREINPQIVFLMETKLDSKRMENVRRKCGFVNGIDISATGSRWGLSLGWKSDIQINLRSFSDSYIDVEVINSDISSNWRLTGFYGSPVTSLRHISWDTLRSLGADQSLPWLSIGDYNEILMAEEKKGGMVRSARQMDEFRSAVQDCDLSDLGYTGRWYTWEKGKFAATNVRERLDRGLANPAWWDLYPNFQVSHLSHSISDHCPVLVDTIGCIPQNPTSTSNCFSFDANWVLEEDFEQLVSTSWIGDHSPVPDKLERLALSIKNWCRGLRSRRFRTNKSLKERLEHLSLADPDDDVLEELTEVKLALNLEADKEEIYWEQRAHVNWLQHGDRNTTFFHKWATFRQKKNIVRKLRRDSGSWEDDEAAMANMAKDYFSNLFTSESVESPDSVLELIPRSITSANNACLLAPISKDEFHQAVKQMAPLKASGLDGFPALFYQQYWHIVGEDVSTYCNLVLRRDMALGGVNLTSIVLVPKVDQPVTIDQFRPISLCSVLYKIMAKALANRIRPLLDKCIDPTQSVFVPGRAITDNILIAYELMHSMKIKKHGKAGSFALKLDMAKAYDRVSWGFFWRKLCWRWVLIGSGLT
ncbi:hypothetical protein HRI_004056700 [Hibiscus trionum]|uniref:Reverse transcriptase domain-containing protein n=1 Tax=Hibiscus trionum TaxID=183268 RepID=A0A9W7IWI3_HIBTR|nr:hypothetical protein HRI_004056700 [Hibiscus trionum]